MLEDNGSSSIQDSTDVFLSSPGNGQVLAYNSGTSKWVNSTNPSAPVTSVSGKTGVVSLVKADVGLDSVDNTADSAKSFAGSQITSGTVAAARLGSGSPTSSNYLRGDGTWATPSGGGSGIDLGSKWVSVADHGAVGNGSTDDTAAIKAAITAAGTYGTVYFPPTSAYYRITSYLKPLERQIWEGGHAPRYAWDDNVTGGSIIRAASSFSGAAVIYNDNSTTNGLSTAVSRGVTIRNLGIFGNGAAGEDGAVDGIDFGPASGSERAWTIERCQIMYTGTALSGHQWVVTVRECHIARNGYGLSPQRGVDTTSRVNDSLYTGNYFYFNNHHAVDIGGSVESGLMILSFNRFERSGVSMNPMDPNSNRDATACGIQITRATCVNLIGNTTDANAGPGLRIAAASHGSVNNVNGYGNIWKRDGTGDNATSMTAGVSIKDSMYVNLHDIITYGDPDDGGAGRIAPQYGLELEANDWFTWDGTIQLENNTAIRTNGVHWVGTANWMCRVTDTRQPVMQFPSASTANAPLNPQMGSAYYDTTLDTLRIYDGAAWDDMTGGGGGGGSAWQSWSGTQTEYDAVTPKDAATMYAVSGSGGVRRLYTGSTLMSEWTATFSGLRNSFIGITSGTAITTGNSGSTSGDAFSAVSGDVVVNTSADLTTAYDRGLVATLTASQNSYVSWSHADYSSSGYIRCYVRRSATPGVTQRVARGFSGGTNTWEVRWQADGQIILANVVSGEWIKSVAGATALNTIYRIEAHLTTTDAELRVYPGESGTALTEVDQPGVPQAGAWDSTRFGLMTTSSQTMSIEVAAVAISNSDWIGQA